jgi:hypothetical protein
MFSANTWPRSATETSDGAGDNARACLKTTACASETLSMRKSQVDSKELRL